MQSASWYILVRAVRLTHLDPCRSNAAAPKPLIKAASFRSSFSLERQDSRLSSMPGHEVIIIDPILPGRSECCFAVFPSALLWLCRFRHRTVVSVLSIVCPQRKRKSAVSHRPPPVQEAKREADLWAEAQEAIRRERAARYATPLDKDGGLDRSVWLEWEEMEGDQDGSGEIAMHVGLFEGERTRLEPLGHFEEDHEADVLQKTSGIPVFASGVGQNVGPSPSGHCVWDVHVVRRDGTMMIGCVIPQARPAARRPPPRAPCRFARGVVSGARARCRRSLVSWTGVGTRRAGTGSASSGPRRRGPLTAGASSSRRSPRPRLSHPSGISPGSAGGPPWRSAQSFGRRAPARARLPETRPRAARAPPGAQRGRGAAQVPHYHFQGGDTVSLHLDVDARRLQVL